MASRRWYVMSILSVMGLITWAPTWRLLLKALRRPQTRAHSFSTSFGFETVPSEASMEFAASASIHCFTSTVPVPSSSL